MRPEPANSDAHQARRSFDRVAAFSSCRHSPPLTSRNLVLVQHEHALVLQKLLNLPDQKISRLRDIEGNASGIAGLFLSRKLASLHPVLEVLAPEVCESQ
ncbi:MAG: hypothetical protein JWM61_3156 [Micrococcaceae bacterium]|jgi:hypothetical protein|nr:hypothetical protein [Micrococcaceae bacterium]